MIHWLDSEQIWFPPVEQALRDPPGLLAAGGDLAPARLLQAYALGIFPWYEPGQPILWWSPDPRAVLVPARFRLRRSLRKTLRNSGMSLSFDRAFDQVVQACAAPRAGTPGTWITPQMARAYGHLHRLGHAHSVEVWEGQGLTGGLYGVAIGKGFFAESMFSLRRDASKAALAALLCLLQSRGFALVDCQMRTAHLDSLGSQCVPRQQFSALLRELAPLPAVASSWRDITMEPDLLSRWQPDAVEMPENPR